MAYEDFQAGYKDGYEDRKDGRRRDPEAGDYAHGYGCGYSDAITNKYPDYSRTRMKGDTNDAEAIQAETKLHFRL